MGDEATQAWLALPWHFDLRTVAERLLMVAAAFKPRKTGTISPVAERRLKRVEFRDFKRRSATRQDGTRFSVG